MVFIVEFLMVDDVVAQTAQTLLGAVQQEQLAFLFGGGKRLGVAVALGAREFVFVALRLGEHAGFVEPIAARHDLGEARAVEAAMSLPASCNVSCMNSRSR